MDAKSKANFINSIADGQETACPECEAENGKEMVNDAPAFAPASESVAPKAVKYVEPTNVFAQGLPEWSIEPPQVMVRRR